MPCDTRGDTTIPRDSQGVYTLPAGYLATTGQTIQASQHNPPLEDLASAVTGSLPRAGTAPMTGDLNLGGFTVTNSAPGSASTDLATVGQITPTFASDTNAASAKTTPAEADVIPIIDTTATPAVRKVTWVNFKAALRAFYDTVYAQAARTVTGGGLATGGGDLSANRTITVTAASTAQASAATLNTVAMTPFNLKSHPGVAKAWVSILGNGTIRDSFGITSVVRTGVGAYTITFAASFLDVSYAWNAEFGASSRVDLVSKLTGSIAIQVREAASVAPSDTEGSVIFFGTLA